MKLTLENKKRAVEIAASGANPLPFLRSLGIKNASATWCLIKKGLQKADPETFAKLPASFRKDAPVIVETPEGNRIEVGQLRQVPTMTVTAIRDDNLGEFHFDCDRNSVEWRTGAGEEVLMGVDGWRILADRLPEILKVLGVRA